MLAPKGITPGLAFGMSRAAATAAATAAFGVPTASGHNGSCSQGPMDLVSFHDLQLAFQEGRLAGWTLSGASPALRSASGLGIGAPRSALGGAEVDEEGTLGPEFEVAGVEGVLDQTGEKVAALWAGLTCQFR
jgi:hypothetical protein